MKTNNTFLLLLFLLCQIVFGQDDRKQIHGIIRVDSVSVEGVNIVNETTQKATSSDKNGNFYVFLKEGDLLVFSAVNLVTLRKKIGHADLEKSDLLVQLLIESILLKEVIVKEESRISAESLGIVSPGQKKIHSC